MRISDWSSDVCSSDLTPLIISGAAEASSELYKIVDGLVRQLQPAHYEKDEKVRAATLTDAGQERVEELLRGMGLLEGSLYDVGNIGLVHHPNQALRANVLFGPHTHYKHGRAHV